MTRILLFVFGAVLLVGVAFLLVRAVIEGQWAVLGIFGALVLLEVAYDRWFSKRKLRREDEEAERLTREGTGSNFTTPSGSGG